MCNDEVARRSKISIPISFEVEEELGTLENQKNVCPLNR